MAWQGKSPGLLTSFVDLAVKIVGKHDSVFLFSGACRPFAHMDQVGTYRRMRPMFFQYAKRQNAGLRRFVLSAVCQSGSKLVPAGWYFLRKGAAANKK